QRGLSTATTFPRSAAGRQEGSDRVGDRATFRPCQSHHTALASAGTEETIGPVIRCDIRGFSLTWERSMSSVAPRLRRHLDEHGVAYRLLEHEPAGTAEEYHALLGTRYEQQAKSGFVRHKRGAGGGFGVFATL